MTIPKREIGHMQNFGEDTPTIKALRSLAEQGDAKAQFELGFKYYHGDDVQCDYREAAKWFRLAGEQGHAAAQFSLGVRYQTGRGVPRNDQEAAKWYGRAAAQGLEAARVVLSQDRSQRPDKRVLAEMKKVHEKRDHLFKEIDTLMDYALTLPPAEGRVLLGKVDRWMDNAIEGWGQIDEVEDLMSQIAAEFVKAYIQKPGK